MENLYLIIAFCGLPDNKSNAITAQPRCLLLIIMQCKKSFRTRLYREKLSRERGTFSHPSQLSECVYDKKKTPLLEPTADNSARACSDCLALTELTRLGESKCLYGEKLARLGGWPYHRQRMNQAFCFSCKHVAKFCRKRRKSWLAQCSDLSSLNKFSPYKRGLTLL